MSSPDSSFDASKQEMVDFGIYYLDMVECPLNPHHKVRRHRLLYHLVKCRKNFPNKLQCPYSHSHYLDSQEMANHLLTCSSKPRISNTDESSMEAHHLRNQNLNYNYDVNNYQIDEPYWD